MCTLISTYISTEVDSDARVQKQAQPRFARPNSIVDICPLDTCVDTAVVVSSTESAVVENDVHSLFFVHVLCDLEMMYSSPI